MFTPKKSLGQNFLKSRSVLNKIVEAADIKSTDTVLEIGPGLGTLTEKLLEKTNTVIAIEKDRRLIEYLQEKFAKEISNKKLILIEEDILKFTNYQLLTTHYKLVANIPYYITGAIFKKFLEEGPQPQKIVLLVQKEVAQRIVGRQGKARRRGRRCLIPSGEGVALTESCTKESILSLSVKAYGEPKIVAKVPAGAFSPRPKVDSAILLIDNVSKKFFIENKIDEKRFFEIIKKGFAHKRKTLAKNLGPRVRPFGDSPYLLGGTVPTNASKILKKCGLPEKVRAEDLKLNDWVCLIKNLCTLEGTDPSSEGWRVYPL